MVQCAAHYGATTVSNGQSMDGISQEWLSNYTCPAETPVCTGYVTGTYGTCKDILPSERINCGSPGMGEQECKTKGCLFDNSVPGVPWCYQKPGKPAAASQRSSTGSEGKISVLAINDKNELFVTTEPRLDGLYVDRMKGPTTLEGQPTFTGTVKFNSGASFKGGAGLENTVAGTPTDTVLGEFDPAQGSRINYIRGKTVLQGDFDVTQGSLSVTSPAVFDGTVKAKNSISTNKICVGDTGSDTCVSKDKWDKVFGETGVIEKVKQMAKPHCCLMKEEKYPICMTIGTHKFTEGDDKIPHPKGFSCTPQAKLTMYTDTNCTQKASATEHKNTGWFGGKDYENVRCAKVEYDDSAKVVSPAEYFDNQYRAVYRHDRRSSTGKTTPPNLEYTTV